MSRYETPPSSTTVDHASACYVVVGATSNINRVAVVQQVAIITTLPVTHLKVLSELIHTEPIFHLCFSFQPRLLLLLACHLQNQLRLEGLRRVSEEPLLPVHLVRVSNQQNFFRRARLQVGLVDARAAFEQCCTGLPWIYNSISETSISCVLVNPFWCTKVLRGICIRNPLISVLFRTWYMDKI